ncbi:hypothetical protein [Chitinophaga barathri]|uniref:Uncharacterized protein n=1 Tax=Chitinophaga barathri TaxID=1647451 RepID=A0A3N4MG02_9BACT|nr:hypothetical protein [Chitinophaga barathri]RPD39010.1 hypothetical protein EG028_23010 [Chitinophaga barathri]
MRNLLIIGLLMLFPFATALAQNEQDSIPFEQVVVEKIFGKNKTLLFFECLKIYKDESFEFVTVLNDYETEKHPWFLERLYLLKIYNEQFESLDEQKMFSLTKRLIASDREYTKYQMRYYRRMIKVLGVARTAQFFQLDNYIEQATRAYLQNNIPFIKQLESHRLPEQPPLVIK